MEWDTEQTKHLQVIKIGIKFFFFFFKVLKEPMCPLHMGIFVLHLRFFPTKLERTFWWAQVSSTIIFLSPPLNQTSSKKISLLIFFPFFLSILSKIYSTKYTLRVKINQTTNGVLKAWAFFMWKCFKTFFVYVDSWIKNCIWQIFILKVKTTYNFYCAFDLKEQLLSKSQKMLLSWNLILTKDCCSIGSKILLTLLSSHTYSLKELTYLWVLIEHLQDSNC